MNSQDIKTALRQRFQDLGWDAEEPDIKIQRDPYRGWNIAIISTQFVGIGQPERRQVLMLALAGVELAWLDLLTPEEVEWAGPLPGDLEPEQLPLWPEALARGSLEQTPSILLASDLDEDLAPPLVATFYSLRGGVGRSTALAHTARILAARRKKVVCVDMDLEAPALPILLGCDAELRADQGVVDILMTLDQGATPDYAAHILPAPGSDGLFVVPAGRISADYARKLRFVNPGAWYREERNPLQDMMEGLKSLLPFRPDAILLDARTGITDLSGPLLFDLADIAVIVFFPHPQTLSGTELLARSILRATTGRSIGNGQRLVPEVRFLVSPIPATTAPELKRRYMHRPLEWISGWLEDFNDARQQGGLDPVDANDITHFVQYREDLATSDSVVGFRATLDAFEPVADWLQRFLRSAGEAQADSSVKAAKPQVLADLDFSAGTAEEQAGLLESFVRTESVDEALSMDIPLVLGRKGTGKTALFRFLLERGAPRAVAVHAPRALSADRQWQLTPDGFAAAEEVIARGGIGWRHFWTLYAAIALDARADADNAAVRPAYLADNDFSGQGAIIDALERTRATSRGALDIHDWLRRIDAAVDAETLMLFDGLDTGFGSTAEERERRRRSIEGLFEAWMDVGQGLASLRFKIMLREDIWRQVNFANKSHLYGKTVPLKWSNQTSFLKVVMKQAMRAESFRKLPFIASVAGEPVDRWSDDVVYQAWNLLVGERMKGGQTTFTRNWVWNRLADANEDHFPRYLLQLFREAVAWERREERRSRYERSFVRPRALTEPLVSVSEQAVVALQEEFLELDPLFKALRQAGRTPIDAAMLEPYRELIPLAREVGLLGVYEESADEVIRFKIPDLYRLGLKMTRKGQA
ncbi:hypothetical protein [uncultured Lamprocystis sp.]|uniref:tyrosine-protein kinase family protein n=1 Tax=uncultured Lamprocystis sp. TaxID=543132 RepID=UPI0025D69C13|nr:hypothetical protein [uncultured Lamprocystis sp.]